MTHVRGDAYPLAYRLADASVARLRVRDARKLVESIVAAGWEAGWQYSRIAREAGISLRHVRTIANDLGLKPRPIGYRSNQRGLSSGEREQYSFLAKKKIPAAERRAMILADRQRKGISGGGA